MNSFETISFTEVRDRAKAKLRELNSTMQDMYIDLSILDANRRILSTKNICQKTSDPLTICDYCVDLPTDFASFIALAVEPVSSTTLPLIYTDYPFDAPNGANIMGVSNVFVIQNGKIRFPSDFEAEQVVLFYNAYLTDDAGFPLLRLSHVDYYVFSVIQELYEAKGDYKSAMYWEKKKLTTKRALLHNEQVDQFNLDKTQLRSIMYKFFNLYGTGNRLGGLWQV